MRDQSVQDVLPSVRNSKVSFDIYHCDFCEILFSQENLVQWGKGPESTMQGGGGSTTSEGEGVWPGLRIRQR